MLLPPVAAPGSDAAASCCWFCCTCCCCSLSSPVDSTSRASGTLNRGTRCHSSMPLVLNSSSAAVCRARAWLAAMSSTPPGCTSCTRGGSLRVSCSSTAARSSCCLASCRKCRSWVGLQSTRTHLRAQQQGGCSAAAGISPAGCWYSCSCCAEGEHWALEGSGEPGCS